MFFFLASLFSLTRSSIPKNIKKKKGKRKTMEKKKVLSATSTFLLARVQKGPQLSGIGKEKSYRSEITL